MTVLRQSQQQSDHGTLPGGASLVRWIVRLLLALAVVMFALWLVLFVTSVMIEK